MSRQLNRKGHVSLQDVTNCQIAHQLNLKRNRIGKIHSVVIGTKELYI